MDTKLKLSSACHLQNDGQAKRIIHSLEDLLRAYVLEQGGNWDSFLPLVEFTYNNNFHSSIGMILFEELYCRWCMIPLCWYDSGESVVLEPEIVQLTTEKIKMIQENMKSSQTLQKIYHEKRRKTFEIKEGNHVFSSVTLITGVGSALKYKKLMPHFIGLFQVLQRVGEVA